MRQVSKKRGGSQVVWTCGARAAVALLACFDTLCTLLARSRRSFAEEKEASVVHGRAVEYKAARLDERFPGMQQLVNLLLQLSFVVATNLGASGLGRRRAALVVSRRLDCSPLGTDDVAVNTLVLQHYTRIWSNERG